MKFVNQILFSLTAVAGVDVTWKLRRSLLGLSLMSSIGAALIITSVITALLHRTQHTQLLSVHAHRQQSLLELNQQINSTAFEKDSFRRRASCSCTIKQTRSSLLHRAG